MTELNKGAFMGRISKQFMVEEAQKHIDLDMYRAGTYGHNLKPHEAFKACSVGCSIYSINQKLGSVISTDNHAALAKALNIPEYLVYAQDIIFEWLEAQDQILWTKRFYQAIPEGADLSGIVEQARMERHRWAHDCTPAKECADILIEIVKKCENFN